MPFKMKVLVNKLGQCAQFFPSSSIAYATNFFLSFYILLFENYLGQCAQENLSSIDYATTSHGSSYPGPCK